MSTATETTAPMTVTRARQIRDEAERAAWDRELARLCGEIRAALAPLGRRSGPIDLGALGSIEVAGSSLIWRSAPQVVTDAMIAIAGPDDDDWRITSGQTLDGPWTPRDTTRVSYSEYRAAWRTLAAELRAAAPAIASAAREAIEAALGEAARLDASEGGAR